MESGNNSCKPREDHTHRCKAKESAGRHTGDEELEAEGRSDRTKGNLKQAGEKVKDAFRKK